MKTCNLFVLIWSPEPGGGNGMGHIALEGIKHKLWRSASLCAVLLLGQHFLKSKNLAGNQLLGMASDQAPPLINISLRHLRNLYTSSEISKPTEMIALDPTGAIPHQSKPGCGYSSYNSTVPTPPSRSINISYLGKLAPRSTRLVRTGSPTWSTVTRQALIPNKSLATPEFSLLCAHPLINYVSHVPGQRCLPINY